MRICRIDLEKIHDWCVLQEIKNKIVGDEYEALELYPARSRHMDEGNIYHLWILAPNEGEAHPPKIPVGHLRKDTTLVLQQHYENMDADKKQKLKANSNVIIFPDNLLPVAKEMFPREEARDAMMKYTRRHAEQFYK